MSINSNNKDFQSESPGIISTIGYILAVSYPLLALSTGTRAIVRLFFREGIELFPPAMSAVAATLYILATIGFAYRRRWSWWLSILSLGVETILTIIIGVMSYVYPELIGSTVWRHFGEDYGYFPLFQPILGLIWLMWPQTLHEYGFADSSEAEDVTTETIGNLNSEASSPNALTQERTEAADGTLDE